MLRPLPECLNLPDRPRDGHKGTFGTVVVVGGSPGFGGAAQLAALGAARAGAGLVRACVPEGVHAQVASGLMEVMVHALPAAPDGGIAPTAVGPVLERLASARVLVLGPGLSTGGETRSAIAEVLRRLPCPAVVDADALTCAAAAGLDWRVCPQPVVLTPHPGEMARLIAGSTTEVKRDRTGIAAAFARDRGVTVVLKGEHSVVASLDGRVHVDEGDGVVALATGGTGDVLAGVIGAMIAQGLEPFAAAVAGVTVHAEAGAAVEAERGRAGAVAGDVLEALPAAQERIRRELEARER